MSDETSVEFNDAEEKRLCGLVVDFDYALVDGADALAKACERVFAANGVSYSAAAFARRILGARIAPAVNSILGAEAGDKAESVIGAIVAELDAAVAGAEANPVIVDICSKTLAEGGRVVFMTSRPIEAVEQKLQSIGIEDAMVFKVERNERFGEYQKDAWVKAARLIKLNPRCCTVFVATGRATRQAVMAGMHTVAFPSRTTEFQDFSGADLVVESGERGGELADHILGLMATRLD